MASMLSLSPISHSELQWHAVRTGFHRNLSLILRNTDEGHVSSEWMALAIRVLKKQSSWAQKKDNGTQNVYIHTEQNLVDLICGVSYGSWLPHVPRGLTFRNLSK